MRLFEKIEASIMSSPCEVLKLIIIITKIMVQVAQRPILGQHDRPAELVIPTVMNRSTFNLVDNAHSQR